MCSFLPSEFFACQCCLPILGDEEVAVLEWDLDVDPFKFRVDEREEVRILCPSVAIAVSQGKAAYPELVSVLGSHHAFALGMSEVISRRGDVDEKPVLHVNPPGIHDVERVILAPVRIVRVDVQQKRPTLGDGRVFVVIGGHVVICRQEINAGLGDHDIGIVVPGEDLLIPPPSEEASVHDPGLDPEVSERGEVSLYQNPKGGFLVCRLEGTDCESPIVVHVKPTSS